MIPKECKRLAEVDFPIAVVSKHAPREKSIRHGHPSTLHLWWARRPLASSRAVLLGLLLPDPCDPHCPEDFKTTAKRLLPQVGGGRGEGDEALRQGLLKFIGDFANWDLAANKTYLDVGRALVQAAYAPEAGEQYEPPLVVDPFSGGGSIPLEALRLDCEAFASDLNPVACMILKVMLEDIPREGLKLAEELRRVGAEIKREADRELADLYPHDPDGATPITYLWARTVRCESPNCGAEIPLARSLWLCKKSNRKVALRHHVVRRQGQPPSVEFEIFEPKTDKEVHGGTISRAKATCLCCGTVLSPDRVRAQISAQHGGADVVFNDEGLRTGGARLLAVVASKPGEQGRNYRRPAERDYQAVLLAQQRVTKLLDDWETSGKQGLCPVPDEPLPPIGTLGFRVQRYGMLQWGDLFTARQKLALICLSDKVKSSPDTLKVLLAILVDRVAVRCTANCVWDSTTLCIMQIFNQGQALPFRSEYAEMVPLADDGSGWSTSTQYVAKVIEAWPGSRAGQLETADATHHPLPDEAAQVWFTDPPYYDAVPYADLSDFFLVWLKRALPGSPLLRDPFDPANPLTPKQREAVQDETKQVDGEHKDRAWFEVTMAKAFAEGRRVLHEDGVGSVVFAHKTTEGWEALLSGMIRGGWTITGSWPIATESRNRLRAKQSAALATSVHLVCRPRPDDAGIGDWGGVLSELPRRVGDWMERLQDEGVRGADLVFACIGPALEIFSRYTEVETAEGREVTLAEYLPKVWEVVGRAALENVLGTAEAKARNGAAGALEEDARLTALFLWTLGTDSDDDADDAGAEDEESEAADDEEEESGSRKKAKGFTLPFDVTRRFAQPLGIDLDKWKGRVIDNQKGIVRLLPVAERAEQLFGKDGAQAVASRIEEDAALGLQPQMALFPAVTAAPAVRGRRGHSKAGAGGASVSDDKLTAHHEATTLDRVHAAMLLQSGGRTNALRALLKAEVERGPDFLRLANALSALYPRGSEEKRLLDAMLLAAPK